MGSHDQMKPWSIRLQSVFLVLLSLRGRSPKAHFSLRLIIVSLKDHLFRASIMRQEGNFFAWRKLQVKPELCNRQSIWFLFLGLPWEIADSSHRLTCDNLVSPVTAPFKCGPSDLFVHFSILLPRLAFLSFQQPKSSCQAFLMACLHAFSFTVPSTWNTHPPAATAVSVSRAKSLTSSLRFFCN